MTEGYDDFHSKSVLVTGAGGFVGSHLTEELVRIGARVKAFVHYNSRNEWGMLELLPRDILKELEIVTGDIQDPFFVRKIVRGYDVVFHLAALIAIPYSYVAPQSYVRVNVEGTLNLLQACLEAEVERVIHTSTSEVYGSAKYVPISENHPLNPQSPYASTKVAADKLAESYYLSFDLPLAIIRPFNTFGPRQSARAVIPAIIIQALAGDIVRLGSLEPVRDLTYVKDTIQGFLSLAKSQECVGEVINIGTGQGVTVNELVLLISKILGKELHVVTEQERKRPEKSEVMKLICDCSKAKKILDWRPKHSLEDGLREVIAWIRENLSRYKMEIYNT